MLLVALIFIAFATLLNSSKILPETSKTLQTIQEYLAHQNFERNTKISTLILKPNSSETDTILTGWFSKWSGISQTQIFDIDNKISKLEIADFSHALVFVRRMDEIKKIASDLSQGKIVFLVYERYLKGVGDLELLMEKLWNRYYILDYVIVFVDERYELQVVSYNPFTKSILNYSSTYSEVNVFPNKIKNLHGYRIKISLFSMTKFAEITKDKCKGKDCEAMKYFFKTLNASAQIMPITAQYSMLYSQANSDVSSGKIDVAFNRMFFSSDMREHALYTFEQSDVVGFIAQPGMIPFFLNIKYMFDGSVWILIVVVKLTLYILSGIFEKCISKNHSLKLFGLLSSLYTLIITNIFQGGIITTLVTPKYEKILITVDDLVQSNYPIYGEIAWAEMINRKLLPQFHPMSYTNVARNIWKLNETGVYLSADKWAEMTLSNKTKNNVYFSEYYYLLRESLGSGMLTYNLKKNSPYRDVLLRVCLSISAYGLDLEFGEKYAKFKKETERQKLTIDHLQCAFLPLGVGLALSILIFIVENLMRPKNVDKSYFKSNITV